MELSDRHVEDLREVLRGSLADCSATRFHTRVNSAGVGHGGQPTQTASDFVTGTHIWADGGLFAGDKAWPLPAQVSAGQGSRAIG